MRNEAQPGPVSKLTAFITLVLPTLPSMQQQLLSLCYLLLRGSLRTLAHLLLQFWAALFPGDSLYGSFS